jgi:hypothetical protein
MNLYEKETINKIKHHYDIANELIKINQINKAKQELFNKMSKELYDISLDLIDNRNLKVKNHKLKLLISKVLKSINDNYLIEKDSSNTIKDDYLNKIF